MGRPRLTYANVMSTITVFIALGGTSWAVAANSVGNRQLKANAVTSAKVRNGTLTKKDLSPGALVGRGQRGPTGPSGPAGPAGPAGPGQAEGWKALPFTNGWGNYGSVWEVAGYRKDPFGIVHLRGLVTRASGAPAGNIAILPAGYRPQRGRIFAVHTGESPYQAGRVNVEADGSVSWTSGAVGETDYTSLDGVFFDTD
jgi:hypothetical protein